MHLSSSSTLSQALETGDVKFQFFISIYKAISLKQTL